MKSVHTLVSDYNRFATGLGSIRYDQCAALLMRGCCGKNPHMASHMAIVPSPTTKQTEL
jgi:hypothetical protein